MKNKSVIEIQDRRAGGSLVAAELLEDVPVEDREAIDEHWSEYKLKIEQRCIQEGAAIPENLRWSWRQKGISVDEADCRFFAIQYEAQIQGVIMVNLAGIPSELEPGERALVVEYLESAPTNNKSTFGDQARFGYVGDALLRVAVQQSIERGFGGRLFLEALGTSVWLYQSLGFTELERNEDGYVCFELDRGTAMAL